MIPNIRITTARLAALLVLAALLCAGVQAAVAEDALTIARSSAVNFGTDPTISNTISPENCGYQLHHQYTHFSPMIGMDNTGNLIPWMAESYDISDDYRTITFHLRKGITFADGTPFNASVAKFNFERIINYGYTDAFGPNGTSSRLNMFIYFDKAEVINEYTLKIYFTKGWLAIAFDFARSPICGCFISPLDVVPVWDTKGVLMPEKKYNGLGPYYVDENESIPKEKVVLRLRPSWRDDLNFHEPKMDKIVLIHIADPQTSLMAMEKGEIDYIDRSNNPPVDSLIRLKGNSKITILASPDTQIYYIATAYWRAPFNGTEGILLRKAINYALDREKMVKGAFFGYATPATDTMYLSPQRADVPDCCYRGYDFDIEKAKQLFAEAGWSDTDGDDILDKNGKPLKLDLLTTSRASLIWMKDLALIIQSQMKEVGIDVEIRTLDASGFVEASKMGDYDMRLSYDQPKSNPTTEQLTYFLSGGILSTHYANENGTLERNAMNVRYALDEEDREQNLCQICDVLFEEAGVIPLVHPMTYAIISSRVRGFEIRPEFYEHIEECWIED
ncbi:MAG: putative ABC transporter periplasmic-binding protein [Methanosaeta sp. PtaU1.Bin060]|nr:MAG: putative ABC transporter periplasmic-binding protein [Methanosaeta sp. PtaU1.Bin060]